MNRKIYRVTGLLGIVLLFLVAGCTDDYVPKPRGYFRIDLPPKSYRALQVNCPYTFEYAESAQIEERENCWINIHYKGLKARVHLTYKAVNENLEQLLKEVQDLSYKHVIKADGIQEKLFENDLSRVYGMLYVVEGNAASPSQFYVTDSSRHFLRGALYFQSAPNSDSLAPVTSYIQEDIIHLIESIQWNSSVEGELL